jgi:Cdc6-like AAA superfamily ATPase
MDYGERLKLTVEISQSFTPSAPIDRLSLFAGRTQQVTKLINTVSQRGQHAVLFGERGVGKTSLATVLKDILGQEHMDFAVASTNCEAASTFASIFENLFSDLPLEYREQGMGFGQVTHKALSSMRDVLPVNPKPEDIRKLFAKTVVPTILIIDEIDRIEKGATTVALADTIKTLSDHASQVTLILVGVADSVDGLIKQHASVERALAQIPMPRMSEDELLEIIDKGLKKVGMTADSSCADRIAKLSHGLPHYTHSLALHAAQAAVARGSRRIDKPDIPKAIETSITDAQQSIVSAYNLAIASPRENLFREVLLACALAPTDELGYFTTPSVREPMSKIMGRSYEIPAFARHLNDFCTKDRGQILQRAGAARRYKFRFKNPLMEPYVVMKGISQKLIEPPVLDTLS